MADKSSIEWTDASWNPVTGCDKISDGCKNCYAEKMSNRLKAMGSENYKNGFKLTLQPQMLNKPLSWKRPRKIFVNSMSDLFHDDVPLEYIKKVFGVMGIAKHHIFQVLTKRAERLFELCDLLPWPPNVWMGVSVENKKTMHRIKYLRAIPATVKFISFEPLLGFLDTISLNGIDWVIVGGESGPGARPMDRRWVYNIRNNCVLFNVPFFFKQWGGVNKKKAGRLLDGMTYDAMPKIYNGE